MTINSQLLDAQISHNIDLQRYANHVVNRIIRLLNDVDADLYAQIVSVLDRLPKESFTVERLDALLSSVRTLNSSNYAQISNELNGELKSLVEYEAGYQKSLFENTIPVQINLQTVNVEQVYAAALSRPFQGRLLKEWMQGLEADKANRIRDALRIGYVENQTTDQIIRRIRGSKSLNYKDGIIDINKRSAESVVRTALTHYGNFTKQRFYEDNSDVIKGLRWTSTLDARTSEICASRDGKIYPIDSGPRPPAHFNCRSIMVAVTKSWKELGFNIDELPPSTRSSMDGQVADDITYEMWLRKKPFSFQEEVLGKTKAKLFRDGGLSIDRFSNNQGKSYTLEQLKKRDAEAFKKAGL